MALYDDGGVTKFSSWSEWRDRRGGGLFFVLSGAVLFESLRQRHAGGVVNRDRFLAAALFSGSLSHFLVCLARMPGRRSALTGVRFPPRWARFCRNPALYGFSDTGRVVDVQGGVFWRSLLFIWIEAVPNRRFWRRRNRPRLRNLRGDPL